MARQRGNQTTFAIDALLRLTGPRPRVVIAFSGGIDSTTLAHALSRHRRKFGSLRLVHIDHGLQAASAEWERHCARIARGLRLPFVGVRANLQRRRGESPEAAARQARYALLADAIKPGEVLVTAQHRDDQAETLLLQLFRGAGVAGLAAMPPIARFGAGRIARPLLQVSRADIERYAREHALRWVEDPTNMETQFARNFLRARVLPAIRQQWIGAVESIARSARHMAEADQLLTALGRADLARAADGDDVNVAVLRTLPAARRRNTLRAWMSGRGIETPTTSQMREIAGRLLAARADAQPEIRWPGAVVRRRGGRLLIEVKSEVPVAAAEELISKSWLWSQQRECLLNQQGESLSLVDDPEGPIDLDRVGPALEVRAREGGETIRLGARARTQALKKLIQAAKMSVETRARLPLLFSGDRLVAAGDRWIDASILANDKSPRRARLVWSRRR